MISIIVALDAQNAIGYQGDLLCHLSDDLKHFKSLTMGHPVIMGKRTFLSLPRRPLPHRPNIVLTTQSDFSYPDTLVAHDVDEVLSMVSSDEQAFVIGGGQVYELLMPYADRLYITHIRHTFDRADTFFPIIDPARWLCTECIDYPSSEGNDYPFAFAQYIRQ